MREVPLYICRIIRDSARICSNIPSYWGLRKIEIASIRILVIGCYLKEQGDEAKEIWRIGLLILVARYLEH